MRLSHKQVEAELARLEDEFDTVWRWTFRFLVLLIASLGVAIFASAIGAWNP